jgi:hypothetical protein
MRRLWLRALFVAAAALACAAASDFAAKSAGSAGVAEGVGPDVVATPSGPGRDDEPPAGLAQYFRATGENCYLIFSNFGLFGCYAFQTDYGFHYNVGAYYPPEKHGGLYSWTDAPTLAPPYPSGSSCPGTRRASRSSIGPSGISRKNSTAWSSR